MQKAHWGQEGGGPQPSPSSPCSPWGLHAGGRFHLTFLFSLGEHSLSGSSTMHAPVCQPQGLMHPSNSPMGEDIATLLMRRRQVRGYSTCSRLELVQPGGRLQDCPLASYAKAFLHQLFPVTHKAHLQGSNGAHVETDTYVRRQPTGQTSGLYPWRRWGRQVL